MCPIINGIVGRGKPISGIEAKSVERKIRLEPYLDKQLTAACKELRISRSEAIRQGIQLFLKEADKVIQDYYY